MPNVQSMAWSPTDNIFVCFVQSPEQNIPSKISMFETPSFKEIASKSIFNVTSCSFYWNKSGKYLAAIVGRTKMSKNVTNIELFRVKQKGVPRETIEITENILRFSWEPHGDLFGIIHGSEPFKRTISFYSMKSDEVKLQSSFNNENCLSHTHRKHYRQGCQ